MKKSNNKVGYFLAKVFDTETTNLIKQGTFRIYPQNRMLL